jgi:pimeloyl-ACP methyl ester carboxylesterase/class 3 adenylate cyclase
VDEYPRPRYAVTDDGCHVAYVVLGEKPVDIVIVPGFVSHLEVWFDHPRVRAFLERLASFSRLILFDKRGTGLSDRADRLPDLDRRMQDVRAVMDAAGSDRAVVCGLSEGGSMAALFAAASPERTRGLILYGSWAWFSPEPEAVANTADFLEHEWGTGAGLGSWAPSVRHDDIVRQWWARFQRLSASPSGAVAIVKAMAGTDVRDVLPAVRVPTLVIHCQHDRIVPIEQGRYLADHIEGARFVEIPGADHVPFFEHPDLLLDEIEEFVTGVPPVSATERRLATVVVTDVCGSTEQLSELGDQRWHRVLDEFDRLIQRQVARNGGRVVKTLGDGALLVFDGPTRAIRCAQAIGESAAGLGLATRAGVHTGEVELRGDDIAGIAVHLASRVSDRATAGEVLVTRTVVDLIAGSGIAMEDRGEHVLKGIDGARQLYLAR